jgi:hypothetical protein
MRPSLTGESVPYTRARYSCSQGSILSGLLQLTSASDATGQAPAMFQR